MHATLGYLKLKLPGGIGQEFEVSKSKITVGRGQTNDIVIQDVKLSRSHARFEFEAKGEVTVIDAGSTNGVIVNGAKVSQMVIKPGDIIQVGESEIQYEKSSAEEVEIQKIARQTLNKRFQKADLPSILEKFEPFSKTRQETEMHPCNCPKTG